jgi:collagenase-like PrtC family protease
MKFAVGYQLSDTTEADSIVDVVGDFKEHIEEVYFPWLDMPSGRMPLANRRGFVYWDAQGRLEQDLRHLKEMGVKLDLLFNANCYGRHAASQFLANQVCSVIEHLGEVTGGLDAVTTTSLAIARTVKQNFKGIDVRASVNMRIGTVKGMRYVADLFDSFYVQREYNRDFQRIEALKAYADAGGKHLFLLVNSPCLSFCSGQVFHDNLVAHEMEIAEMANMADWNPTVCWNHYRNAENWVSFLQNSWIRPEDMENYEPYFAMVKLATRMHANPRMVVQAYVDQEYAGNLADLFEPGYGPVFYPYIIDNSRFPEDWFGRTTGCDKRCNQCGYCRSVLRQVLIRMV